MSQIFALGLSTQVPLNAVYLTDGTPRKIKIGSRAIVFKKTSPKNLAAKGPISGVAIQALKAIGENRVNPDDEAKVLEKLRQEDQKNLLNDITIAPEWIRKIMKKAIRK